MGFGGQAYATNCLLREPRRTRRLPSRTRKLYSAVVLNCANIGHTYARAVLRQEAGFDWEGVRIVTTYYEEKGFQVHAVCKAGTLRRNPIPEWDHRLRKRLLEIPDIDAVGPGADDLYTLRLSQVENCPFVDNDNYRDWKKPQKDPHLAGASPDLQSWLRTNEKHLKVSYVFTAEGCFVPQWEPEFRRL